MKTVELNKLTPKRVVITPEEAKEGIVVSFGKDFVEGEIIFSVEEPKPIKKTGTRIKGHPNCVMGECLECHVVSCAVHQGFEEAEPDDDELVKEEAKVDVEGKKKVTVKGHPDCEWGECDDCHVVSCPIYLGYEVAEPSE